MEIHKNKRPSSPHFSWGRCLPLQAEGEARFSKHRTYGYMLDKRAGFLLRQRFIPLVASPSTPKKGHLPHEKWGEDETQERPRGRPTGLLI